MQKKQLTKLINIRFTEEQIESIKSASELSLLSMSAWIRQTLLKESGWMDDKEREIQEKKANEQFKKKMEQEKIRKKILEDQKRGLQEDGPDGTQF
jgi:hypothetical protein